ADQPLALILVDDHVAGAQFFNIVRSAAKGDVAGVMKAVPHGGGAACDPLNLHRYDLLTEDGDDPVQRPHPAQAAAAPAHRLGPGEFGDDALDRLRENFGGGAAGMLDD